MKFFIIGISDSKDQYFPQEIMQVIQAHSIFSGGRRHHKLVCNVLPENSTWIEITVPLNAVFSRYADYDEVVVFASGDPLFFGFANTIQRTMQEAEIVVYPTFNSLQLLAHRMLMPYHDMHVVSLTGRPWHKFDEALILGYDKIGVLTDSKEHTPARIAERMLYYGYDNYTVSIGELLGNNEEERVSFFKLEEVLNKTFAYPNNLILQKTYNRTRYFGIPEREFHLLDNRAKMITKMPIRLLSLSLLELNDKSVFWDVGFCTGSVSVEAKLQFPHLHVVAFEQRSEGKGLLDSNARAFGTPGILPVMGDFVEADISSLPTPDAVFIGGHGGRLNEIVSKVCSVLQKGGVIVFNSVSEDSRQLFISALEKNNLIVENSISMKVDDYNAIEVLKTRK